jgi:hypothetical protein
LLPHEAQRQIMNNPAYIELDEIIAPAMIFVNRGNSSFHAVTGRTAARSYKIAGVKKQHPYDETTQSGHSEIRLF